MKYKANIYLFHVILYISIIQKKITTNLIKDSQNKIKRQNLEKAEHEFGLEIENFHNFINFQKSKEMNSLNYPFYIDIIIPKLSIITPIYRGEDFLISRIKSFQAQTFQNYEVIFIDDFSPDNSSEILMYESLKDKRIKIIKNKNNRGTLYSRYNGSINSEGEFIYFSDQDDLFTSENVLKVILETIKKTKADLVHFNFIRNHDYSIDGARAKQPLKGNILNYEFYCVLWDKILKREILIKAYYNLGKNINIYASHLEDHIIIVHYLKLSSVYYPLNKVLVYFNTIHHKSSATSSFHSIIKKLNKGLKINDKDEKMIIDYASALEVLYESYSFYKDKKKWLLFSLPNFIKVCEIFFKKNYIYFKLRNKLYEFCIFFSNSEIKKLYKKQLKVFCKKLRRLKYKNTN